MDNDQARSLNYYATPSVRGHNLNGTHDRFNQSHSIKKTANHTNNTSYSQAGDGEEKKPKNAQEHVVIVDQKLDRLKEDSIEMKRNLDLIRMGLERTNNTTEKSLDDFTNMMMGGVESKLKELLMTIEDQKDENTKMQAQITELRKENSEMQQRILIGGKKHAYLATSVGEYEQDS